MRGSENGIMILDIVDNPLGLENKKIAD